MNFFDKKHFDFLKSVSIFSRLSDVELKKVIPFITTREVNEKETVFARLEKEQLLYIVRYGRLRLVMAGQDDKIYEKGAVFGELAVLNNHFRTGSIKAEEASLLLAINGPDLLDPEKLSADISIKIVVELAKMISGYLSSAMNISSYKLIEQGESDFIEFKSTLRYNLFTNKFDKEIEHAVLKTIAAFLNSSGGTLFIGVDDKKNIIGLGNDKFKDEDHILLHLNKLIQDRISMQHTRFILASIESSNGLQVLRVDVKPAPDPAYVTHNNEEVFYVRSGPLTAQLRVSEIYDYVKSRFYQ